WAVPAMPGGRPGFGKALCRNATPTASCGGSALYPSRRPGWTCPQGQVLLRLLEYDRNNQPVIAFAPDRLHGSGTDTRFAGDKLDEPPHAAHIRVGAVLLHDTAAAHDIVHHDQAAGPGEPEPPGEIVGIVLLVGIDEDEVEGGEAVRGDAGQRVERPSEAHFDHIRQPGAGDVLARHLGVSRHGLEADEAPAGR